VRNLTLAIAIFAQAMTLGGTSSEAAKSPTKTAIQSGSAALQAGAYQSAVDQFTKAIDAKTLDPKTTAITLLNRGLANQQLNQFVAAITDYDRALQERKLDKTTRAVALYNRGLANRKLYRTTLALEDFTNALLLNPKFAQAYNSRANVLRELGYYATAIQDYDAAVRHRHPQVHIPLYGKALSHAAVRNLAAAKDALTRALHVQPKYQPARRLLARITTVPKPDQEEQTDTMVAENQADRITTGTVDEQTTTIVVKNNLPWAPAPNDVVAATTPPEQKPGELLITDNETAESIIASASITPLDQQDVFARPTSAPADQISQNVVTSEQAEDPSLRSQIQPGKTLLFVPGPGTQPNAQPEAAPASPASENAQNDDAPTSDVAALEPAESQPPQAPAMPDGFLIQISAQSDPNMARSLWNNMSEKHSDILGNLTPYIIKVQISGKGTIYRVRAGGFGDRAEGSRLCSQLKRRRVSCYVTAANK
jgi:tetratricopeptide (TPR) repeat protein